MTFVPARTGSQAPVRRTVFRWKWRVGQHSTQRRVDWRSARGSLFSICCASRHVWTSSLHQRFYTPTPFR